MVEEFHCTIRMTELYLKPSVILTSGYSYKVCVVKAGNKSIILQIPKRHAHYGIKLALSVMLRSSLIGWLIHSRCWLQEHAAIWCHVDCLWYLCVFMAGVDFRRLLTHGTCRISVGTINLLQVNGLSAIKLLNAFTFFGYDMHVKWNPWILAILNEGQPLGGGGGGCTKERGWIFSHSEGELRILSCLTCKHF